MLKRTKFSDESFTACGGCCKYEILSLEDARVDGVGLRRVELLYPLQDENLFHLFGDWEVRHEHRSSRMASSRADIKVGFRVYPFGRRSLASWRMVSVAFFTLSLISSASPPRALIQNLIPVSP